MDRLKRAQGRFARVGRGQAAGPADDDRPSAAGPPTPRQLEALALASMALGWECVQAADEAETHSPELDADWLAPALGQAAQRPGSPTDWERFDAAWRRVRRELRANDLVGVGLALIDFAQACRITADRLAGTKPVTPPGG